MLPVLSGAGDTVCRRDWNGSLGRAGDTVDPAGSGELPIYRSTQTAEAGPSLERKSRADARICWLAGGVGWALTCLWMTVFAAWRPTVQIAAPVHRGLSDRQICAKYVGGFFVFFCLFVFKMKENGEMATLCLQCQQIDRRGDTQWEAGLGPRCSLSVASGLRCICPLRVNAFCSSPLTSRTLSREIPKQTGTGAPCGVVHGTVKVPIAE